MSEALTTIDIPDETRTRLILAIAMPEDGKGLPEIAEDLGLSVSDIVDLMSSPGFMKELQMVTRAQVNIAWRGEGIRELVRIARSGEEERNKLTALRTLAQLSGDLKNSHSVDVRLTFEDLRKRESNDPLSSLFDIRSQVIDAGEVDE